MGLFDFALKPGQRFTKEELRVLDQNFNSISAYTKRKYRFSHRRVATDINGSHYGVDNHTVNYSHQDINNPDEYMEINCTKYFIKTEQTYSSLMDFYDSPFMDDKSRVTVPKLTKFPTFVLCIGWPGSGYINEFKYNSDGAINRALDNPHLTDKCIKEIEANSIKFLKNL